MTYETFERLVRCFKKNYGLSIELTGGEASMNPDLDAILKLALDEFAIIGFLTNGTILKDSTLDLLTQARERVTVGISLDSVHPEIHDRLRGRRKAFERTVRNIRRLTERDIPVRMGSVLFKENMWELRDLAQLAVDLGARLFSFNFVEKIGRGEEFEQDKSIDITPEYVAYINSVLEEFKNVIPIIPGEQFQGKTNCGAGSGTVTIDPSGRVRPCALFPSEISLGNVLTTDWAALFDRPVFHALSHIPSPKAEHGCPATCPNFASCYRCYLKGILQNTALPGDRRCPWVQHNNLHWAVDLFASRTVGG